MMSDYDFVIFLSGDWDTFFRRYLLRVLAKQLPMSVVLCVDRPVCLVSTPFRDPNRWIKQVAGRDRLRKLGENLFVYKPWVFLHDHVAARIPIITILNRNWLKRQLKLVTDSLGLRKEHLIVWIFDPFQEEYLGLLNERLMIYECYDEYTANPSVPLFRTKDELARREKRILDRVDMTFVVSEALYENKKLFSHNINIVPNAVDARHFGSVRDENTNSAEDIADISPPIIGYLGNLTDRIDFGLLLELAKSRPEWSVVLIGGIRSGFKKRVSRHNFEALQQMRNVHLCGPVPYENIPGYLKVFDVCIIPYITHDPFNIHCSPLKLYEYLATGKPIVTTDLPAVRSFKGLLRIARDGKEFKYQIEQALMENDETLQLKRIRIAQENSWEKRAKKIIALLEKCL